MLLLFFPGAQLYYQSSYRDTLGLFGLVRVVEFSLYYIHASVLKPEDESYWKNDNNWYLFAHLKLLRSVFFPFIPPPSTAPAPAAVMWTNSGIRLRESNDLPVEPEEYHDGANVRRV